jgi:predicted O-linked N-acetylglucosamine transferase (SPINDLY family)
MAVQTRWNFTELQRNCIEFCEIPEKYYENAMETYRNFIETYRNSMESFRMLQKTEENITEYHRTLK